jgi:hypothetical protein
MTVGISNQQDSIKFSASDSNVDTGGGAHNNKIRYCKYCGKLITLQCIELVEVLHPYSMFNCKRVTTKRWVARDYFGPSKQHTHRHKCKSQREEEVAA